MAACLGVATGFFGTDLFDGSKHEDIVAAKDTALVPEVKRTEYDVQGQDEDGFLTLMDDQYERRFDLKPPSYPEGLEQSLLAAMEKAQAAAEAGEEGGYLTVRVAVIEAMGMEAIKEFKIVKE